MHRAVAQHITPVHPGMVLQDELDELHITQSALAEHIGVLPKTINEICRGKRGLSAGIAMKLSQALGASPQFWLNLQNNWELSLLPSFKLSKLPELTKSKRVAA